MGPEPSPIRSLTELAVGTELAGRFVVEKLLGRGGMGAVYCVLDRALGERVALKIMSSVHANDADAERFRREVKLARRITHRNVARTYDLGEEGGALYLTMELLSGPSLKHLLRSEGALPPERAAQIVAQLCDGLRAAHDAGVVHRDLKPHNATLEPDGRVVIVDFGIAHSSQNPRMTSGIIGTPAYMAPEQLEGMEPDARTDLYGVGLILHELLSGDLPTWSGAKRDIMARVGGTRPQLALAGAPEPLVALVEQLLSAAPEQRPASAEEVARRLRALEGDATELMQPEAAPKTQRFAPMPTPGRVLAVLPFAERGTEEGLGGELAEELVDALSRVHGLNVLASGATARFGRDAEPERVGRELGAELLVTGTVQRRDNDIRITVRLVEVSNGLQIWTERLEGASARLLECIDRTAQRIAESLRLELSLASQRGEASSEAIELYLEGNRRRRRADLSSYEILSRAVELAPGLRSAIAARALAAARRAFVGSHSPGDEFLHLAESNVEAALSAAPEYPETQLAAAVMAAQRADYAAAAMLLRRAVTIAPTFAEAQEYLGMMQVETGRLTEGVARLELAMNLDPLETLSVALLWRHHALQGDQAAQDQMLSELSRRTGDVGPLSFTTRVRSAVWSGNKQKLVQLSETTGFPTVASARIIRALIRIAGGFADASDEEALTHLPDSFEQPRFAAVTHQLAAEGWSAAGRHDRALHHIVRAASGALIDLQWLERCKLLVPLHGDATFIDAVRRVRDRASAIWTL